MKETTLLKTALICSLVGLLILYFISAKIEVRDYKPGSLNKNIGDDVKLTGTITKITAKGDVIFLEVSQKITVNVVVFADKNNLTFKNSDAVEILGKVEEYNGKEEIIADKVRVIK